MTAATIGSWFGLLSFSTMVFAFQQSCANRMWWLPAVHKRGRGAQIPCQKRARGKL